MNEQIAIERNTKAWYWMLYIHVLRYSCHVLKHSTCFVPYWRKQLFGDEHHQISCGDNRNKLYLLASVDSILMTYSHGVQGVRFCWLVVSILITNFLRTSLWGYFELLSFVACLSICKKNGGPQIFRFLFKELVYFSERMRSQWLPTITTRFSCDYQTLMTSVAPYIHYSISVA